MVFKQKSNFVLFVGILASVIFWLFDATIDTLIFGKGAILVSLFFPDTHELYMRSIVFFLFLFVTFYARTLLIKQESITRELKEHKNNLESLVHMRTEQLEKLASTDELTQILNRRQLYNLAGYELNRCLRYKSPLSVIMIDIDHFKKINDTYGHDVGDKVLQQLSQNITNIIRKSDIFGRTGGEEFILVLPETDKQSAKEVAEKIRLCIANEKFSSAEHITVSLGVTECIAEDKLDSLFKRVDIALYTAKKNGRNQVVAT